MFIKLNNNGTNGPNNYEAKLVGASCKEVDLKIIGYGSTTEESLIDLAVRLDNAKKYVDSINLLELGVG